jgi:hypothetical protein
VCLCCSATLLGRSKERLHSVPGLRKDPEMMDKNNLDVADVLQDWIEEHVER